MQINNISYSNYKVNAPNPSKQTFGTNYKGFPNFITVSINEACNLSCSYCPNSLQKIKPKETLFPMELFRKFLKELNNLEYDDIFCFHRYNEPLLTRKAEDYISETNKYIPHAKTTLYTNGIFLTSERLKQIQNAGGVRTIIVTEHTPEGSFISRLPEIDDDLLKNIFVRQGNQVNKINRGGILLNQPKIKDNLPCDMPKNNFCIDTQGDVVFCPDDYYKTIIVGDIKKQTATEIVESEKFKYTSESLLRGERDKFSVCKNCNRTKCSPLTERISAIDFKKQLGNV